MTYKITINGEDYTKYIVNGFSIVERLDEELDEGTMELKKTSRETPFEMFYSVNIYIDDTLVKSLFISEDTVELSSKNPLLYNHSLTLIERTKKLEKYFISHKTFTQPIEEGLYDRYNAYEVVKILRDISPIRHEFEFQGGEPINETVYKIPQETKELLEDFDEVEFNFNGTLRECLDEVASLVDGNVFLDEDDNLRINLFNDLKDKIENVTFNNKMLTKNIEYYGNTMVSDVVNAIIENPEGGMGTEFTPHENSFTNTRSESFLWDFTDAFIPTQNPIYKVNNVTVDTEFQNTEAVIDGEVVGFENIKSRVRITSVFEQNYLETLPVATVSEAQDNRDIDYQNTALSYVYGQKNIGVPTISRALLGEVEGFSQALARGEPNFDELLEKAKEFLGVENVDYEELDTPLRRSFIVFDVENEENTFAVYSINFDEDVSDNEIYVNVEYQPVKRTVRTETVKDYLDEAPFKTYVQGNQQSRIVELPSYLNRSKAKINRLGLTDYTLSDRVDSVDELLKLGDFFEDGRVITQREVIFFKDYIRVIYQLNREFNKSNERVGINSEERQYEIGESGRTLERNINYNEYVYIDVTTAPIEHSNSSFIINSQTRQKIMDTLTNEDSKPINLILTTSLIDQPAPTEDFTTIRPKMAVPFTPYYGGNQISMHFTIDDNYSLRKRIKRDDTQLTRFLNAPTAYTDEAGRIDTFLLNFNRVDSKQELEFEELNNMPLIADEAKQGDNITNGRFKVFKDNREELSMNIAFDFVPSSRRVIIGNEFSKKNNLLARVKDKQLKIRFYNELLTTRNKNKVPQGELEENLLYDINYDEQYIQINNSDIDNFPQWAICDENGNTYLIGGQGNNYINFEFKRYRDFEPPELVGETSVSAVGGFGFGIDVDITERETIIGETISLEGGFGFGMEAEVTYGDVVSETISVEGGFGFGMEATISYLDITETTVQAEGGFGLGIEVDYSTENIIPPLQVETPSITFAEYNPITQELTATVVNNDLQEATIEIAPSSAFSDTASQLVASGESQTIVLGNQQIEPNAVYARASVPNRDTSEVTLLTL